MPTLNLKAGGVTTTESNLNCESNGTMDNLNILTGKSESYTITTRQQSHGLETRDSDFKIAKKTEKKPSYGKLTKTYEYRRRANLAKAREMAVKMESYKKHLESPSKKQKQLKSPTKIVTASPRLPTTSASYTVTETRLSNNLSHMTHDSKHENNSVQKQQKIEQKTSPRTARRTGGGFKSKENLPFSPSTERSLRYKHVECQTCAADLTNWEVLTDVKIMRPSPALWSAILKKRDDDLKRAMLKEERFVPEYSKSEVNYQTNLKEFLETGVVRHYDRDFENQHEEKLLRIKSTKSDDLKRALRYRPIVKPEMDLKKRLPKIEEELLRTYKSRV